LRLVACLLCLLPPLASADIAEAVGGHKSVYNDVEEKGPWTEERPQLPAYPRPADLIEFYVSPTATNHFFVDGISLSVGKDGVVRYVLVIETSGGARNVSFEGIHCATREYKIYATGRADGTWLTTRAPVWRTIENKTINRYHAELNRNLLCPIGNPIGSAEEGRDALRRGKHPLVP
jgi:hypothetical protein